MSPTTVVFLVHVLVILTRQHHHMVSAMLPFGDSFAGSQSPLGLPVSLPSSFTFYEQSYSTIYANTDGFVSFTKDGTVHDVRDGPSDVEFPVMCIFCADIIPTQGPISAHLSTEASDLQTIANLARKYEDFESTYTPTWAFVVTWDNVASFVDDGRGNTMQMVVASDGTKSLVMYEYVTIDWYQSIVGIPIVFTWVGFSNGTNFYNFEESKSENLTHLTTRTNIDLDGFFLFRVDQSTINAEPVAAPTTTTTMADPTTTPTTTITDPTTITTTTTTSTPMNASTSQAVTTSESQVTTVPTTEETKPSSTFDSTPYIVGAAVSVGVLAIVGTVAIVVYKMKVRACYYCCCFPATAAAAAAAGKVAVSPAPLGTADMVPNHDYSSAAPVSGLLALGAPFRIPRPTSSPVPVHSVTSRSPSSSSAASLSKPVTSHAAPASLSNGGTTRHAPSKPSFMSLVV